MARYLITGIAGFIGSTLAHALVEQGDEVRGIDNLCTGSLENLAGIRDRIDFQQSTCRTPPGCAPPARASTSSCTRQRWPAFPAR